MSDDVSPLERLDGHLSTAERAGVVADGGWFGELARTKSDEHPGFIADLALELTDLERLDPQPVAALAALTWWVEGYPDLQAGLDLRGELTEGGAWSTTAYEPEQSAQPADATKEPESPSQGQPWPPTWVAVLLGVLLVAECISAIALGSGAAVLLAFATAATGVALGATLPRRR